MDDRKPRNRASGGPRRGEASRPPTPRYWTRAGSRIHGQGLFAACDIPKGTRVIEYVGIKLTKARSLKRATEWMEKSRGTSKGAVYVFELNARHDIDGNVPWNIARVVNHSCKPNCETQIVRGRIWIVVRRRIPAGEELTYDYGYDLEHWEDHPCHCGSDDCLGYIVGREHRAKLRRLLVKGKQEAS